jgi:hypothetical protein
VVRGESKMKTGSASAMAKMIYHELLHDITTIDVEEYDQYVNLQPIVVATWKRYKEEEYYEEVALENWK